MDGEGLYRILRGYGRSLPTGADALRHQCRRIVVTGDASPRAMFAQDGMHMLDRKVETDYGYLDVWIPRPRSDAISLEEVSGVVSDHVLGVKFNGLIQCIVVIIDERTWLIELDRKASARAISTGGVEASIQEVVNHE